MTIHIQALKALKDNYIWLITSYHSPEAWIVDPGEAAPVLKTLAVQHLQLTNILITHHHYDHTAGVPALLQQWPNCQVYASHLSPHDFVSERLHEGDKILGKNFELTVLDIPGHTLDHIAYYNSDLVFTGDTLFSAGCGRIFEGTPQQMYQSLNKLQQLPDEIAIYCGHEYTLNNLLFAAHVEPDNPDIQNLIVSVKNLLNTHHPSLPSTLSLEKKVNPFLRCQQKTVVSSVEQYAGKSLLNAVAVFAELRQWKNQF